MIRAIGRFVGEMLWEAVAEPMIIAGFLAVLAGLATGVWLLAVVGTAMLIVGLYLYWR